MKKMILALAVLAVVAGLFVVTGSAYAQTPNPQNPQQPWGGMMGQGRGRMMQQNQAFTPGEGPMHAEMVTAFAAKLGVTVEELEKQLDSGKTMAQVAADRGLTAEQFQQLWADARAQALDAAVKAGKITQAQADWMKTRGGGMMNGQGRGRGGRMGRGQGVNPGCPYYTAPSSN